MEEYELLALDYGTKKGKADVLECVKEQLAVLEDALKSDLFLSKLKQTQKDAFFAFATRCNLIAAEAGAEFSLAVHSDTNEASAVMTVGSLELGESMMAILSDALYLSDFFTVEPIEEKGSKLAIYFHYLFSREIKS